MDDFLLNSRFTTQRDVIVGGSDAVPDISHFVAEEIIISDVTSGSPETSYYGSCGEGSPGSSSGFLDDLVEIKDDIPDDDEVEDDSGDRSSKVIVDVSLNPSSLSGYIEKGYLHEFEHIGAVDEDDYEEEPSRKISTVGLGPQCIFLPRQLDRLSESPDDEGHAVELSDVYAKPKLSYAQLIAEALMAAEERMLTLSEIYTSVAEKHPYYKMDRSRNWQNAIRHNLTLNKCFTKVPRPASEGRGSFWRLEDGAEATIFRRIMARHQTRMKQMNHFVHGSSDTVYVTIPAE